MAWHSGRESACDSTGPALEKLPPECRATELSASTVLPAAFKDINDPLFYYFTSMWITTPEKNEKVKYSHENNRKVSMFWIRLAISSSLMLVVLNAGNLTPEK